LSALIRQTRKSLAADVKGCQRDLYVILDSSNPAKPLRYRTSRFPRHHP
jgi:hypothetical protein